MSEQTPKYGATETVTPAKPQIDKAIIDSIITSGDLSKLSADQKVAYYNYRCRQIGIDPAAKPFDYLRLNGKEILYANATCTQQLANTRGLSTQITRSEILHGVYTVAVRVTDMEGRGSENLGAVSIDGMKGEALANALMKASTKGIRRAILAHCGLGMMDETEVITIPGHEKLEAPVADDGRANADAAVKEAIGRLDKCDSEQGFETLEGSYEGDWLPRNKAYKEAKEARMKALGLGKQKKSTTAPKRAIEAAPEGPSDDIFKMTYGNKAQLMETLEKAATVPQLADLYYVNIEAIEKDAALKTAFTKRKLAITEVPELPQ